MSSVTITPLNTATQSANSVDRRTQILNAMTVMSFLGFFIGLGLALFFAETDPTQGQVQRIFYMHVSAFSGATIAFFAGAFGGIAYLVTRKTKWDTLSLAGVEVGFALSLITLITGMVWARPTWNTWWTWDPRLTSAAIMSLTYAAYFMFRGSIESLEKRRTFAAVYAMLAITTVILTFMITRIRPDTIHPTVIGPSASNAKGGFDVAQKMGMTLGINSFVWSVFIAPTLMWWRIRLANLSDRVAQKRFEVIENSSH